MSRVARWAARWVSSSPPTARRRSRGMRSGLHARARVTSAPRGLEAPSAGPPRLCRFTRPPALHKRHLHRYARAWAHPPLAWTVGSICSHEEPARGLASSEDNYEQTVTGCEVARGCPVAGRRQCLQAIGCTATAARPHRGRVCTKPWWGLLAHGVRSAATWVQDRAVVAAPGPRRGKPTQAARKRRSNKPSPCACKKWGLTQRLGSLSYPTRGRSFPMGPRASRAHGSWGGWRRSQGARRPVRPSAFAGVGPPLCRC